MSTPRTSRPLVAGLVALGMLAATTVQAQTGEPVGRTLRDPSRTREPRAAAKGPGAPAVEWFLTPNASLSSGTRAGAQLKGAGDVGRAFTFVGYGAYSYLHGTSASHNRVQLGGELDRDLTSALSLAGGGEWGTTSDVSTDTELYAEVDASLAPIATTLGGVVYYDWTKPSGGGDRTGGATFGVTANWKAPSGTRVLAEYDFRSDFNGEDSFSAKLVQGLGLFGGHSAQAIVGAAKHRIVSASVKIWLQKSTP